MVFSPNFKAKSQAEFDTSPALQLADFRSPFSLKDAGIFSAALSSAAYPYVNLTGSTQFRLRFSNGDNNDFSADFMKFYSGNASMANRPQLVIEYIFP